MLKYGEYQHAASGNFLTNSYIYIRRKSSLRIGSIVPFSSGISPTKCHSRMLITLINCAFINVSSSNYADEDGIHRTTPSDIFPPKGHYDV